MPELTPAEKSLRARLAVNTSWANTTDRTARTEPGRRGLLAKFEREVDPDRVLDSAERARRAEYARKAYFQRLALASSKGRREARARTSGGAS